MAHFSEKGGDDFHKLDERRHKMLKRYRGVTGKARSFTRPDPLVGKMGEILEKILDIQELVPNVDFLLQFARNIVEYRSILVDGDMQPEQNERRRKAILERIDLDEGLGLKLGFTLETLRATSRLIADSTTTSEDVRQWQEKLQQEAMTTKT